jgi:large repetitive protein
MKRHWGIQVALAAAGLVSAGLLVSGCGSGGGSSLAPSGGASTAGLSGRLTGPASVSLAGTQVVAELLVGGRTATLRAISAPENAARRASLVAAAQNGSLSTLPGVYTTTTMPDGSFLFRNLPPGEYSLMARSGNFAALRTHVQVGGARVASASVMSMQATGTINGKVRYPQPNEATQDNSGILVYVAGTSLVAFTTGSSGDYAIPNVPSQDPSAGPITPYVVGTIAGGFADDGITLLTPLSGASATAPLIYLNPGAKLSGRISDPTISNIEQQGLSGVSVVSQTGQSTTSTSDGFFTLIGLPVGGNFLTFRRSGYRNLRRPVSGLEAGANNFLEIQLQKN